MKIVNLLYIVVLMGIIVGCESGRQEVNNTLLDAETAMQASDFEKAVDICDKLCAGSDTTSMTWLDYCRASIIYAVAYDHDYRAEKSMVDATRCLSKARAAQPDSVEAYLSGLNNEYMAAMQTVSRTLDGVTADKSDFIDHDEYDPDADESGHTYQTDSFDY